MSTSTFKCPQCNAPIFYPGGSDVTIECMFCGHNVIIPPELRTSPGSASSAASPNAAPALPSLGSLMKQISAAGEIAELARNGDKLEAIKRYREAFNVGLAEAQDAVEKMAAGQYTQASDNILTTPQFAGFSASPTEGADPDVIFHIKQLLEAGNKIEAIKLYRQFTGQGLKEAKDAVEAIEAGQSFSLTFTAPQAASGSPLAQNPAAILAVKALLQAGNKIEAIKVYRQLTGLGLKEAKDAVEAMEAGSREADTFQVGSANAYQFERAGRPAVSPTPSSARPGMSCVIVGLVAGVVLLGMMAVAVALLVFSFAG